MQWKLKSKWWPPWEEDNVELFVGTSTTSRPVFVNHLLSDHHDASKEYEKTKQQELLDKTRKQPHRKAAENPGWKARPTQADINEAASSFSKQEERHLALTTAVVSTLAGGTHRIRRWVLVADVSGISTARVLRRWWEFQASLQLKNEVTRLSTAMLQSYVAAVQSGKVCLVDPDNATVADLQSVVSWALVPKNLRVRRYERVPRPRALAEPRNPIEEGEAGNAVPGLDVNTIAGLTSQTEEMKRIEPALLTRYYEKFSLNDRHEKMRLKEVDNVPFNAPIFSQVNTDPMSQLDGPSTETLALAQTYVRANVLTTTEPYDVQAVQEKLSMFTETTLKRALQKLRKAKFIGPNKADGSKTELLPDLLSNLRQSVGPHVLHTAARYKLHLDQQFRAQGQSPIAPDVDESQFLAIANLEANDKLAISTQVPPSTDDPFFPDWMKTGDQSQRRLSAFTLTGEGNRKAVVSDMIYPMHLKPTETYAYGFPIIMPMLPPPSPHLSLKEHTSRLDKRIPIWYDIHDRVIVPVWELIVSAVLSLLWQRPGYECELITRSCNGSVEEWEVDLVIDWLHRSGLIRRITPGSQCDNWVTQEWWWLVLGA